MGKTRNTGETVARLKCMLYAAILRVIFAVVTSNDEVIDSWKHMKNIILGSVALSDNIHLKPEDRLLILLYR